MNCKKAADLMMKHMDNEIEPLEYEKLKEHLFVCDNCKEDFAAYSEMLADFENANCVIAAPDLDVTFEKAVMAKIAMIQPEEKRSRREIALVALVGVLSALLGGLVLFNGTAGVETVLLTLTQSLNGLLHAVSHYGLALFFVASALILLQAVIHRNKTVKNNN